MTPILLLPAAVAASFTPDPPAVRYDGAENFFRRNEYPWKR